MPSEDCHHGVHVDLARSGRQKRALDSFDTCVGKRWASGPWLKCCGQQLARRHGCASRYDCRQQDGPERTATSRFDLMLSSDGTRVEAVLMLADAADVGPAATTVCARSDELMPVHGRPTAARH